jgi:hypothetical protein
MLDANNPPPTDPVILVRQLNADDIRNRLDALDRERKALLVLLRAAQRARQGNTSQHKDSAPADG